MARRTGDDEDNSISGTAGNDIIKGLGGFDQLFGLGGNDKIFGGDDDDILVGGAGNDKLFGQGGVDTLTLDGGNDFLDGGGDLDFIGFEGTDAIELIMETGRVTYRVDGETYVARFRNIEGAGGSRYADRIIGDQQNNVIYGLEGNDLIRGGLGGDYIAGMEGSDRIFGDAGDDMLRASSGSDRFDGGRGLDWIEFYYLTEQGVDVSVSDRSVSFDTAEGKGVLRFKSVERLSGTVFDDTLTGDGGNNELSGVNGKDTLNGGGGDDVLDGGPDGDRVTGGGGRDLFLFSFFTNPDEVTDFNDQQDRIALNHFSFDLEFTGPSVRIGSGNYRQINPDQFQSGSELTPESDDILILYHRDTGGLYWNSNIGMGGLLKIADIGINLDLSAESVLVF
jgi:Ca2+-binding RTX toxin-like protein